MKPLLELQDVTLHYKTADQRAICALEQVTLFIFQGEFIGLVGPSGCGKSTNDLRRLCDAD